MHEPTTATDGTLHGKVALVTGGSRGIGAATALRLAREGADVAVTYVNGREAAEGLVRAVEALGRWGVALRADAADPREAASAVGRTADALVSERPSSGPSTPTPALFTSTSRPPRTWTGSWP
ncbi:SDR family NAD(P)-dependent oxidoreductase [Streptomyces sp. AS02]|nr:SDR family NAD(P)-dependent oxidoreductase [Streptomyces sp. AS02]